ncbi:putative permease [Desulfocapsa sulfexigens DSM 10523]|uniref:Putative permease n=1 Tax=Desulfocapsa sulfexigens (strain DSM 10523 / SB164P1) TaxID=1167006 RepID=M1PIC8_DESSD|nr:LptF/LptG family permease [Desulfocapsa sulfexigens]AGF79350.1 putative permease [Desulfocapsa sulfexigens DSM 10523]
MTIKSAKFPKLLYSYLATEMLAPFFASFVIMNSVFFLVKLIPFLNVVLELEISFVDFVRLFLYLFPNMFLYSIPMSAMMGVIISFTRLSSDTEILAFKASGLSLYQMVPPVLMVSLAIAILTAYFSIVLIPKSEIAMKQLMFQVAKEKIDKGIKEHQFTEALGDLVVHVERIDKETGKWDNVWVSDMRGQVNPIITMARSGTMTAEVDSMLVTITLENGSLHRPDNDNSQIVNFDKYTINIPLQPPTVLDGEDVTTLSTASMTMAQLQETADIFGRDTTGGRKKLIHYHKRLVLPVGCFILSLLGMPLGLQAGPGKKTLGVPLGLAFFILYYILFTLGKTLAEDTGLPVIVAMWTPNLIFLVLTLYFVKQASNEQPVIPHFVTNRSIAFLDNIVLPFFSKILRPFKKPMEKSDSIPVPLSQPSNPPPVTKTSIMTGVDYLTEGTIHGNVNSHIFHVPGCEFYYCKNCTIEFINTQVAMDSGFEPCRFCKGLLDEETS